MAKYSKQMIDSVYQVLKDENVRVVDGELESAMLDTLRDRREWPKNWFSPEFTPCHDIGDAFSVLSTVYPGEKWNLKCCEAGIYECYVGDETYSVYSFTAERALTLAVWNRHNFELMEKREDGNDIIQAD